MPCSDGGPSQEWLDEERNRQNGAVIGLCMACDALSALGKLPMALKPWHEAHKAVDAQKAITEAAQEKFNAQLREAKAKGFDLRWDGPQRQALQAAEKKMRQCLSVERVEQIKLAVLA